MQRRTSFAKSHATKAERYSLLPDLVMRKLKSLPCRWGTVWAGDATASPLEELDAAIIFASSGELVPQALKAIAPGCTVVCGGIYMSDISSFPYDILWRERTVCSVANLTRQDGESFMKLAASFPIKTTVQTFPLSEANKALSDLRSGKVQGAAVLTMSST